MSRAGDVVAEDLEALRDGDAVLAAGEAVLRIEEDHAMSAKASVAKAR